MEHDRYHQFLLLLGHEKVRANGRDLSMKTGDSRLFRRLSQSSDRVSHNPGIQTWHERSNSAASKPTVLPGVVTLKGIALSLIVLLIFVFDVSAVLMIGTRSASAAVPIYDCARGYPYVGYGSSPKEACDNLIPKFVAHYSTRDYPVDFSGSFEFRVG